MHLTTSRLVGLTGFVLTLAHATPAMAQSLTFGDSSLEVYNAYPSQVAGGIEYVSTYQEISSDQSFRLAEQTDDWAFSADVNPNHLSIEASSDSAFPPFSGEGDDLDSRFFQFGTRLSVGELTEATFSYSGAPRGAVVSILLIDFSISRYVLQMTDTIGEADARQFWLDPQSDYGLVVNVSFDRTAAPGSAASFDIRVVPTPPASGLIACGGLILTRRRRRGSC